MKKFAVSLLVLLMAFSLFANGSKDSGTKAVAKKAVPQIYKEAIPRAAQGQASFITTTAHRLDSTVNEPGVAITWQGGLKNLLVESYEMLNDGQTWILHIRDNAKWHDGEPVTADDFIWSYSAWANPRVSSRWNEKASSIKGYDDVKAGKTDTLSGVTKIDDKTVKVELSKAMPLWMKLEQTYLVVFPEHILGKLKPEDVAGSDFWKNRIGTGPFKWAEYKPDQYIKLVRNEDYYDGAPIIEELYYVIYADTAAMLNAYASGEIHTTFYEANSITPDDRAYYENLPDHSVVTMDKGSASSISLNLNDPDWANEKNRKALRYAIDLDSIINNLYPGAIKANTLIPQRWAWTDKLDSYPYNPEKAKQLLKEGNYSGKKHTLYYTQGDTLTQNLLVAIQKNLKDVGVDIELKKLDAAATLAMHMNGEIDMQLAGTGVGLDPSLVESLVGTGALIGGGYSNKRVDELLKEGKNYATQAEREPIYREVAEILNAELPRIFLWFDIRDLGFSDKVKGPKEHFAEQGTILFNMGVYNEINQWEVLEE